MSAMTLDQAKALLDAVKAGDETKTDFVLQQIIQAKDADLLGEVKKITQSLHNTLDEFGQDNQLLQYAKYGLPDAGERLEYVLKTTEDASQKTLSSAENASAILSNLSETLSGESLLLAQQAQQEITEIMMTQSFQDLTGQVLKRVIMLVTSIESSLIELVEKSGIALEDIEQVDVSSDEEMKGVGPNVTRASQKGVVQTQDEVDDLLNDLGI